MKTNLKTLPQHYLRALRLYVEQGSPTNLLPAKQFGSESSGMGLRVLELAKIHEKTVDTVLPVVGRRFDLKFNRTQKFFLETLVSIEKDQHLVNGSVARLRQRHTALTDQAAILTADNLRLKQEIVRRGVAEDKLNVSLKASNERYKVLSSQAQVAQGQLRRLSHNILSAQEEERKEISRELHDEIAQTLAGISVHLAALKEAASVNTLALRKKIARTQLFVERSVKIVHQFARELRPTLLDDLGLIPALHSHIKMFSERNGLKVDFSAVAAVEQLSNMKRTVLYRVAQEALTNVARHAKASRVTMTIAKVAGFIVLEIKDNGKAFDVAQILSAKSNRRLGLIGMRERLEMTGGQFLIESTVGKGTRISAQIPFKGDAAA